MRLTPIALTLAAASLALASGALAGHKPGHNPGQGSAEVTIAATSPITWGRATAITGTVRGAAAGVLVDLQSDPFPYSDAEFAKEATVPTDAKGGYRFAPLPKLNTRYRVVAQTSTPATSAPALVLVRIRVKTGVSDSTPKRGSLVRFSGSACPQHDGNTVYIQRRTSTGGFGTVARTTLRDAGDSCSTYSRRVRVFSDGVYRVKVSAGGDGDPVAGISRTVRLDAHR